MDVEIRELEALLAVAEERSFTAAARRLHMSQQSVSTLIRRLEIKLGVTLFERTTRRVAPTPVCETLVPTLEAALTQINGALAHARTRADDERPLRLVFTPSTGLGQVQQLIDVVAAAGLAVPEIREVWADEVHDALQSGRYDAALGIDLEPFPGWTMHPWRRQRVDVLVAAHHPFAAAREITVAQLADVVIEIPERRAVAGVHDALLRTFAHVGVAPTIVHSARVSRIAPASVERGEAVSVWLSGIEERHVPDGLVHVGLGEPDTFVTTCLMVPSAPVAEPRLGLEVLCEAIDNPSDLDAGFTPTPSQ